MMIIMDDDQILLNWSLNSASLMTNCSGRESLLSLSMIWLSILWNERPSIPFQHDDDDPHGWIIDDDPQNGTGAAPNILKMYESVVNHNWPDFQNKKDVRQKRRVIIVMWHFFSFISFTLISLFISLSVKRRRCEGELEDQRGSCWQDEERMIKVTVDNDFSVSTDSKHVGLNSFYSFYIMGFFSHQVLSEASRALTIISIMWRINRRREVNILVRVVKLNLEIRKGRSSLLLRIN